MEKTISLIRTGKLSRKSNKSIIETDLDSIRSTFFGKFYEGIIAQWLQEKEGFNHQKGKPCVYWNEILELKPCDNFFISLNKSLRYKKEHNKHTNSDGLFEKNGELYLWEAKNWPKWDEGKKSSYEQVKNLLGESPYILAKQVKICGQNKGIKGILFSWWDEFKNYEELQNYISSLLKISFKFYFTSNIIDDCRKNKYDWYIKLINEQKDNIVNFCDGLLGIK